MHLRRYIGVFQFFVVVLERFILNFGLIVNQTFRSSVLKDSKHHILAGVMDAEQVARLLIEPNFLAFVSRIRFQVFAVATVRNDGRLVAVGQGLSADGFCQVAPLHLWPEFG